MSSPESWTRLAEDAANSSNGAGLGLGLGLGLSPDLSLDLDLTPGGPSGPGEPGGAGNASSLLLAWRTRFEVAVNALALTLFILVAVGGNMLVVFAVVKTPRLQEQLSNLFIINLSCTDLALAMIVITTSLVGVSMDLKHVPQIWCDVCCTCNYVCIIVSMVTLAEISVDRYIAIIHPLRYPGIVNKTWIQLLVGYAWVQGLAFAVVPPALQWVHWDYWEGVCAIDWHREKKQAVYYVIVAFIACFLVPGVIMIFCYTQIVYAAQHSLEIAMPSNASASAKNSSRAAKTVRSLLIVVVFFFVCMTPFCVTKLLKVLNDDVRVVPPYANLTASYGQYMASCVNPFIYAIFTQDYRQAFSRLLRNIWAQRSLMLNKVHTTNTTHMESNHHPL